MKIKKQDSQRMVIGAKYPLLDQLTSIPPILIVGIVVVSIVVLFVPPPWGILAIVLLGVGVLRHLVHMFDTVVVDRPTQRIMVRKPPLWLIPWQRDISFSDVRRVDVDHIKAVEAQFRGKGWRVSLTTVDEQVKIDQSKNEADVRHIAKELRKFIGREETPAELKEPQVKSLKTMERYIKERDSQRVVMGNGFIIDKPTQSIFAAKKYILFGKRRVIPFSDLLGVRVEYEEDYIQNASISGGTRRQDTWRVSLVVGSENVEITRTHSAKEKDDMLYLASEISKFTGKEFQDRSAYESHWDRHLPLDQKWRGD